MHIEKLTWSAATGWRGAGTPLEGAGLVLYFGACAALREAAPWPGLAQRYPGAHVVGCSGDSHIVGGEIREGGVDALALRFTDTGLRVARTTVSAPDASHEAGRELGRQLDHPGLAGVLILSDGVATNGSRLIAGLATELGARIPLSGGLAGDGARFQETLVGGDGPPLPHQAVAVGFYGSSVRFGHGSAGGWDAFGPPRIVTRARDNVLFELDGKPALDLYENYLGPEAAGLPATALLYPLMIVQADGGAEGLVRTVLSIDREERSMILAGDLPEGCTVQLMRGSPHRLTMGAADAARRAQSGFSVGATGECLALMVSCVGRRILMGQATEEEVEAVGDVLGAQWPRLGFYSHGEIAPHSTSARCELHNQTMTITLLGEACP